MYTFVIFVLLVCPIQQFACNDSKLEKYPDKDFTLINDNPRDERNSLPSLIDVQKNIQKSARQSDSPLPNQQTNFAPVYKSVRRFTGSSQQPRQGVVAEPSTSNSARSIVVYDPTDPSRFREIEGPPARSVDRTPVTFNGQDQAYGSSALPSHPSFQPPVLPFPYPFPYPGAVAAFPVPHNYPLPNPYYVGHPYFPHPVPHYGYGNGYVPPFYPSYPSYPSYPPPHPLYPPYPNQVPPFPGYWPPLDAAEVDRLAKLIRRSPNNSQSKAAKS